MELTTRAIVCAALPHGEAGAVVRVFTPKLGLRAGYVRGGRSRRLRPVLQTGNSVDAQLRGRVDEHLPALTVELVRARTHLAATPLGAAALAWLGALIAAALPEAQPFERLYMRFVAVLDAMDAAEPREWLAELARLELDLLTDLGFGLDLACCAATGQMHDLAFVSPKTRGAVGFEAGAPYAARLLVLPPFLIERAAPDWDQIPQALRLTGHFLVRDVLDGRGARILPARARLAELVERHRQA